MATVESTRGTAGAEGAEPDKVDVFCPADGRLVGSVPNQSPEEVAAAAAALRRAQPEWEAIGPDARGKYMLAWLDWIFDNEERILQMVQDESGKSAGDTKIETMVASEVINYYAKNAAAFLAPQT